MQDRVKINNGLNQLKQLFDMVEPYKPNDNIGFRSLKNIGVWLIAYALTEKSQQLEVVQDLLSIANTSLDVQAIKSTIDLLSKADNLTAIINDYVKANGTFDIFISDPSRLKGFKAKAKEVGLSALVDKHLKVDPSKGADLIFDMNNTLKFSWRNHDGTPATFDQGKNSFNDEQINYLTANDENHSVAYDLVQLKDDLFHVVRFGTLQNDEKGPAKDTAAFLIEPVDKKTDPTLLQKNYFDIVSLFKKKGDYQKRFNDLVKVAKQSDEENFKIEVINPGKNTIPSEFNLIVNFPELAGPLKTEEERLGVYGSFLGKTIGSFYAGNLAYLGQRELEYDAKGGTIKNRELFEVYECFTMPEPKVMIEYTTKGPYLMVYEAVGGADYYAFRITDPQKDLVKSFSSSESYKQPAPVNPEPTSSHGNHPLFSKSFYPRSNKSNDYEENYDKRCRLS